ncbi:MAG: Hsp20/alpha crystallin family protein [Bacteroidetes bacterium]|nr:Hsp20/alpha crystallin family protein [Bacteroidota bacterium]
MTLVRFKNDYNPTFSSLLDTLFEKPVNDFFGNSSTLRQIPAVNIKESETDYSIELAAPGLKKEDFKISLDNEFLTIAAELSDEATTESDSFKRREFNYSSFKRSFTLPEIADKNEIKAKYENGLLHLTIPKLEVKNDQSRLIDIA